MKRPVIKTKKHDLIIYDKGYLCFDGYYIIKAYLVELDNELLQDKINKDERFGYNVTSKYFNDVIPKLDEIMPKYDALNWDILQKTELLTNFNRSKLKVFYNANQRYFTYIDNDYLEVLAKTRPNYQLRQTQKMSGAAYFNGDDLEFYIMPVIYRNCFLNIFEGVSV